MTRTSCLLLGLFLLLLGQVAAAAGVAAVEDDERRFSLQLTDVPLDEALRILFDNTPYAFALDPICEALPVTITLSEMTLTQALRSILSAHYLTYARLGDVYHIMRRGNDPSYVEQFPYGPIIIYFRALPFQENPEIVWRTFSTYPALSLSEERVAYTAQRPSHTLPIERGFLPAPDGSCLLVWQLEGMRGGPYGGQTTRWLAVRLLDGAVTDLGETPGLPWLSVLSPLPYWNRWDDHYRLVLVPGSCVFTPFTPHPGALSGALPGPETPIPEASAHGPLGDAQDRLTAYCEQHHQAEAEHLRSAFAKLADEMEVGYLGGEDPTASPYLLLTSLGIPSERSIGREGWSVPSRQAVCSPDGRLIAYADTWVHELLPTPEGRAPTGYGSGARLDVFDVATGQRLWYTRRASVPRWIPEMYKSVRDPIEWTHPRFADLRWSRDSRYLSFTTCEGLYTMSQASYSVTVVDFAQQRPVLCYLPNGSNAFVIAPPVTATSPQQDERR